RAQRERDAGEHEEESRNPAHTIARIRGEPPHDQADRGEAEHDDERGMDDGQETHARTLHTTISSAATAAHSPAIHGAGASVHTMRSRCSVAAASCFSISATMSPTVVSPRRAYASPPVDSAACTRSSLRAEAS